MSRGFYLPTDNFVETEGRKFVRKIEQPSNSILEEVPIGNDFFPTVSQNRIFGVPRLAVSSTLTGRGGDVADWPCGEVWERFACSGGWPLNEDNTPRQVI